MHYKDVNNVDALQEADKVDAIQRGRQGGCMVRRQTMSMQYKEVDKVNAL